MVCLCFAGKSNVFLLCGWGFFFSFFFFSIVSSDFTGCRVKLVMPVISGLTTFGSLVIQLGLGCVFTVYV